MSPTAIGGQGHLGIRKEESFASGGAVDNWQPFISESVELTINNIFSDKVQSTSEQVYGQRGNVSVAGNITFPVSPQNPAQWFRCGLGQSASPYYIERPLPSMLMQIDKDTQAIQASGCMLQSLTFSSSQNTELTCSVDMEAAGMGVVSAGTPSFTASDAPYRHEECAFLLNGVADTSITAWSLTLSNNLVTDLYGTNLQRIDIPAGKLVVTGSFTKLFDDTTERNAFHSATVRSFRAAYTRSGASLIFVCPKIRYNNAPANIGSQTEYILETFNFTAYTDDPANEQSIRISGDFTL